MTKEEEPRPEFLCAGLEKVTLRKYRAIIFIEILNGHRIKPNQKKNKDHPSPDPSAFIPHLS